MLFFEIYVSGLFFAGIILIGLVTTGYLDFPGNYFAIQLESLFLQRLLIQK